MSSQAPQQFCVRWNSYHTNLQTVFPKLLTTENFVDVTLACENRQIKCHKVVLSACSTYFERLLIQNPCKHPIIFMKDMRFSEMQSLVDFMYKGEVNVSQDDLPSLLKSAEALQIRGLCGTENSNNNQDSTPSSQGALPPHTNNCNTSPKHPELNHQNSKSCLQPHSPNTYSNQSTSPSSNGTQRSEKRKRDDSPDVCKFKQETVEEDGLYYGDMECGPQDDDDVIHGGNAPSQQVSGHRKLLSAKSKKEKLGEANRQRGATKENKKSILAERLSQKIKNKQIEDYDMFENHFLGNLLNIRNTDMGDFVDEKIFENEDYLKLWLEHNQELEVSMSQGVEATQDSKSKKTIKKQLANSEVSVNKTWTNPFSNNFMNSAEQKPITCELKQKSKKKSDKYGGTKKLSKVVEGVDLLDFVEPGDLDQFLAGKEVSSSGLSRSAVEQAMLGKYNPNRRYSNEAMWAALMDVKKGGSIYRAAQTHKVPRKSLRNWMKRWHIKSSFPMPQQLKQFVENNRRTKQELRKELANNLLTSLGYNVGDDALPIKEENMADETAVKDTSSDSNDAVLNLKMDDRQYQAVDLRSDKQIHSTGNEEGDEPYEQIMDMSGNVLYDEHADNAAKKNDASVANTAFPQMNLKPKSSEKRAISFSNVEQLAGIQSEN